jgi:hypothetical protein
MLAPPGPIIQKERYSTVMVSRTSRVVPVLGPIETLLVIVSSTNY